MKHQLQSELFIQMEPVLDRIISKVDKDEIKQGLWEGGKERQIKTTILEMF